MGNKCQRVTVVLKLVGFLNAMGFTSLLLRSTAVWPFHAERPLLWEQQKRLKVLLRGAAQRWLPPHGARANTQEGSLALAWHHDSCRHEPSAGVEPSCSASTAVHEANCYRGWEVKSHIGGNAGLGQMVWVREKKALPLPHPLTGDMAGGGVGWSH